MKLPIPPLQLKKRLVQEGLVAPDRFDSLFEEAARKEQNILDILISERVVDRDYLSGLLSSALGVEPANFADRQIDPQTVKLLSEDLARQRQSIVFGKEASGIYDVAMADPSDLETIEFLAQHLKGKVKPFLAMPEDLNRGFSIYGYALGQDFKKLIEENVQASLRSQSKTVEEAAAELPVVAIVNNIMSYGIASRASDIHLEILEDAFLIRYRIDGVLFEAMRLPKVIHSAVAARIKLLSGLKIDEHFKPQDGRFRHQLVDEMVDVRVSVIPTFYGEKVEMRLLETSQKPLSLEELGMSPEVARAVSEDLKKSYGMILSCGPTGSGKTSTLYAFMNILNRPEVNVVTVEDPIEYNMRYVNQTQINPQAGVTFAEGLRSILRQDPNVIMVGEIRDGETADIAVQAALTGHLLLASLHTNDSPTAIPRLFDLGVPPFLAASVLNVIIAQRLVRKICKTCIASYEPGPEVKKIVEGQLAEAGGRPAGNSPKLLYRGKGCKACGMTGYRGRIGIFEVLEVADTMKKLIAAPQFDLDAVRKESRRAGMKTMFEDGLLKAELGLTTIEEVLRVMRE
ncbi:type II/IV secretion system protein [Candidatus Parcubacteria bacterium]|nr:MAG: type II/IV secretion system protein [Candidatus Parcubacteria bacterium]